MKVLPLVFIILSFIFSAFGQSRTGPKFDTVDFSKKAEVAEWLVRYDEVAWKTSDVVMNEDPKELQKLGAEWFCFEDKNKLWHAVYGKFENDRYSAVFHYTMDGAAKIVRVTETIDQAFLDVHARALATATKQLNAALKDKPIPQFNQYIRQNADKTLSVWLLPAFQRDGTAVYGGEGVYTLDPTGTKITKDESYFQESFRGFKTGAPREIWLNYNELEKPTVGAVFFVWYYKSYFTKIFIDNSKSTSTAVAADGKNFVWVNVEKEEKSQKKP